MTAGYPYPYAANVQMGGLKKVLRKLAGPVAAVAAVASGNPQLAVPAFQAGSSVAGKKKKAPPAIVEPPVEPIAPAGFLGSLLPADRNALLIGGTIVGTLLAAKLLAKRK